MTIFQYSILLMSCFMILISSCTSNAMKNEQHLPKEHTDTIESVAIEESESIAPQSQTSVILDSLGLINISDLDSTFLVELIYTRPDNFTGQVLYDDLREAYLYPKAAHALVRAHEILKRQHPAYRLIIYDAARPMSVQKKMWDVVKGTPKYKYVSNPTHGGGLHNYGLAVDIGMADSLGRPLPMGTEVDHLGEEAHITGEAELVRLGKISEEERENRLLLRKVMREAGFRALPSEWWHFNLCSRDEARRNYKLIP